MNNPPLIPQAFATNGSKNTIQDTRQAGQAEEDATWSRGFPNVTMQPSESGGLPPKGMDFNGIFNAISSPIVHLQKGGAYKFDSDYAAKIGGYSIGSVLQSNDGLSSYVSLIDNNTTDFNSNPDSIGTDWAPWAGSILSNEMAGKVDRVIDGKYVRYVIDTYNDGDNWWRKWSDGWLEQGGVASTDASGRGTLNLLHAFASTYYTIMITAHANQTSGLSSWIVKAGSPKTPSNISIVSSTADSVGCMWYACGQGA